MSQDTLNTLGIESCLSPIVKTSTTNATGIDAQGADSLFFTVHYGITADTLSGSVYVTATVQGSAALASGYADLGATDLYSKDGSSTSNAFALINSNAEDDEVYMAGVKLDPDYRYYRVVLTFTGTHTYGIEVAVLGYLGHGTNAPPATNLMNPA